MQGFHSPLGICSPTIYEYEGESSHQCSFFHVLTVDLQLRTASKRGVGGPTGWPLLKWKQVWSSSNASLLRLALACCQLFLDFLSTVRKAAPFNCKKISLSCKWHRPWLFLKDLRGVQCIFHSHSFCLRREFAMCLIAAYNTHTELQLCRGSTEYVSRHPTY